MIVFSIGFAGRHLGFEFLFCSGASLVCLVVVTVNFFFFAFLHFFVCVPEAEVCDAFMIIVEK